MTLFSFLQIICTIILCFLCFFQKLRQKKAEITSHINIRTKTWMVVSVRNLQDCLREQAHTRVSAYRTSEAATQHPPTA